MNVQELPQDSKGKHGDCTPVSVDVFSVHIACMCLTLASSGPRQSNAMRAVLLVENCGYVYQWLLYRHLPNYRLMWLPLDRIGCIGALPSEFLVYAARLMEIDSAIGIHRMGSICLHVMLQSAVCSWKSSSASAQTLTIRYTRVRI